MQSAETLEKRKESTELEQQQADLDILDIVSDPDVAAKATKKELIQLIQRVSVEYAGPIPPPKMLKQYEEAFPGVADRIVRMAEEEQQHRHEKDNKQIRTESRDSLLGIIAAFLIAIVILACGTAIVLNIPTLGGVIAGSLLNLTGVGTIVGTFLNATRQKNRTKEESR